MEIVKRVKRLNSISRARLNFRRRPILCTTLYRNLMQVNNFGGTFDQLFLWIFLWNFYRRCLSICSIPWCKKVKITKNSNQGGGGGCLNPITKPLFFVIRDKNIWLLCLARMTVAGAGDSCEIFFWPGTATAGSSSTIFHIFEVVSSEYRSDSPTLNSSSTSSELLQLSRASQTLPRSTVWC